jgi:hypothetical protein
VGRQLIGFVRRDVSFKLDEQTTNGMYGVGASVAVATMHWRQGMSPEYSMTNAEKTPQPRESHSRWTWRLLCRVLPFPFILYQRRCSSQSLGSRAQDKGPFGSGTAQSI